MPLVFDKENLTILVTLDQPGPSHASVIRIAEDEGLYPKTGWHITVIGSETGRVICAGLGGQEETTKSEYIRAIEEIAREFP